MPFPLVDRARPAASEQNGCERPVAIGADYNGFGGAGSVGRSRGEQVPRALAAGVSGAPSLGRGDRSVTQSDHWKIGQCLALSVALSVMTSAREAAWWGGALCRAAEPSTARDWPAWRGPDGDGVAPPGQQLPQNWSATENVRWKAMVPGRGHGSPTVVGDHVFLATAEAESELQSVLCLDRATGKQRWKTVVHRGGFTTKGNKRATLASSTCACDGERVYVNFLHSGAVSTTALTLTGEILWQTKVSDYVVHQGYGSSPVVYKDLVIVAADNKGGGRIAGLRRETGQIAWSRERPKTPNYASPVVLNAAGKTQLIVTGCNLVTSYAPETGQLIWEVPGATTECVTSTVTDGSVVITSGGYPKNHVSAVKADGSGELAWENNVRVYVPSMVIKDGYLYAVTDAGVAVCWKAATGEEVWKGRLGGTFSASLVRVGELILATSESGKTVVFRADPAKFERVAENQLGSEVFATPAICGNALYFRVAEMRDGGRHEVLYCIAGSSGPQLP